MLIYRLTILFSFHLLFTLNGITQERSSEMYSYCGESMSYRFKYGIFNVGYGSISCSTNPESDTGHIIAEAKSTGWVTIFKNLHYRYESYLDLASGLPNRAIRSLKDGRYSLYNELIFDHHSRTDSAIIFSQMSGQHVVSKNILDILTGFYHFRKNFIIENRIEGEDVVIKTFFTDELWDLRIRYAGEETIKTQYGQLRCYKYKPTTVVGRYFNKDDDMSIWFTKDKIPIPVKIRANLKIGSIILECVEYQKVGISTSGISEKIGEGK